MQDWLSVGGVIFAGAISPGPNNILALRAGLARSARASVATIVGVEIGSLLLLSLCWLGLASILTLHPAFGSALGLAGAAYLAWLGVAMFRQPISTELPDTRSFGIWPIAGMQVFNPKAWIFVAALTALTAGPLHHVFVTAALFVAISSVSLAIWSLAGAQVARLVLRPAPRLWINRAMAFLLLSFALVLAFEQLKRF